MKELLVKVLIRNIPDATPEDDVALAVYKAVMAGLVHEYAIKGYSYEKEQP